MNRPRGAHEADDEGHAAEVRRGAAGCDVFMRDFLYSEIAQVHGIPNVPDDAELAVRPVLGEGAFVARDRGGRFVSRSWALPSRSFRSSCSTASPSSWAIAARTASRRARAASRPTPTAIARERRASSSVDRPAAAARRCRACMTASSTLRIVSCAMGGEATLTAPASRSSPAPCRISRDGASLAGS